MFQEFVIKPITICATLLMIGFCVRVTDNPKLFKICTWILGTVIVLFGIYITITNLPEFIDLCKLPPIDREILSKDEVIDAEKERAQVRNSFYYSLGIVLVGILDILMALKLHKIKNDEVKMWLKVPVIFQLGLIFIITLISMFVDLI